MSGETPGHEEMERREVAAAWLVRLQDASAPESDWLAFEAWLVDPLNKAALAAIETASAEIEDNAAAILAALDDAAKAGSRRTTPARQRQSSARRAGWIMATLAAAAAVAFVVVPTLQAPGIQERVYVAPADQRLAVAFPDGSSALLNQGASLRLKWGGTERQAALEKGEASFKIRHDASHPFRVSVGQESVVDLGTEFNILNTPDALVVTVREGSVRVSGKGFAPVEVGAAAQLKIERPALRASMTQVNAAEAFAWEEGRLIYQNVRLSEIVRDLNRYGAVRIRIADASVGELRFSGVLVIDTSEKMVSQVKAFLPVDVDQTKEEIVLRAR